jgi:flagellar basal-body rod protein FlgC
MPDIFNAIELSASGLSVQRTKMNVAADNMANAETTKTDAGGPYRRKHAVVTECRQPASFDTFLKAAGTRLTRTNSRHLSGKAIATGRTTETSSAAVEVEQAPPTDYRLVHDPGHPDADADGYVKMPDIEIVTEMVDMMAASRAYEANAAAISTAKQMAKDALDI